MNTHDVFISYNRADAPAVNELTARLEKQGLRPWLDEREIGAGDLLIDTIQKGLAACGTCAVFIGPSGLGPWQAEEIRVAIGRRVQEGQARDKVPFRIIPILLPGVLPEVLDPMPFLKSALYIRFQKTIQDEESFARLLHTIRGEAYQSAAGTGVLDTETPYRGLEAFEEKHARFFFGRRQLTAQLVAELSKVTSKKNRLLAVLGPSGSGKSSLARAGLMQMVRTGDGGKPWRTGTFRPGADPLESLALTLAELGACAKSPANVRQLRQDLLTRPDTLHLAARLVLQNTPATRLLLLIDQFEEVFTGRQTSSASSPSLNQRSETTDALIGNLLHAIAASEGPTTLVLTLRTDFLGKCGAYPDFTSILSAQSVVVGPMNEDELREAIEMPARLVGAEVNADLVEALLADGRKAAGGLPLLQDALLELWNKRTSRYLTLEAYEGIGRLEGALEARANAVLGRLEQETPGIKDLCRKIFLRLVQPGEGTADTRKRVSLQELLTLAEPSAVLTLIETLAGKDARLLVTQGDEDQPGTAWVEVAHETLISQWPELRKWIEADRPGFRLRHRLTEAASDWKANHRDRSYLYTGTRLAIARDWIEDHGGELTRLERRFLKASQALRSREEEEYRRERFRQLDQAKALAEEQQRRAEEQAKRANAEREWALAEKRQAEERIARQKVLLGLALVAVVAIFGVTSSVRMNKVAKARMLARQAVSELTLDPQQSVGHAAMAARLAPAEGEDVLRQALWESQLTAEIDGLAGGALHSVFSPNGRFLAVGDSTGQTHLFDLEKRANVRLSPNQASAINSIQFNRDGSLLATASADHTVLVRQTTTGATRAFFTNHTSSVRSAGFGPADYLVTQGLGDSGFWIWSATNATEQIHFTTSNEISKVVFNLQGDLIASGGADGAVVLWKWRERQAWASIQGGPPVRDLVFSPDGSHLLVVSADQNIRILRVSPRLEPESMLTHPARVRRASFSPDGQAVLSLTEDGAAWLWAWRSKSLKFDFRQADTILDASFSPSGEFIVTAGLDRTAQVWSAIDGKNLAVLKGHSKQVNSVAFDPTSQWIATASDDQTARVWQPRLGRPFPGPPQLHSALISNGGGRLLLADDEAIYLRKPGSPGERTLPLAGAAPRTVLSADGQWMASVVGASAQVWALGPSNSPPLILPPTHPDRLALSSDGAWLATFDTNGTAALWRRDSPGKPVSQSGSPSQPAPVDLCLFAPDASAVLTTTSPAHCVIRDRATWRVLDQWDAPARILCAAFTSDGTRLALGCENGLAFIRNRRKQTVDGPFVGHSESIRALSFSPDSQFLVTGSADKTARLWSAKTGFCFATLQGQSSPLLAVSFGSDSRSVITVGESGMVRIYSCPACCGHVELREVADEFGRKRAALAERRAGSVGP